MFESTGFATAEDGHAVLAEVRAGAEQLIYGELAKLLDDDFLALGRGIEQLARLVGGAGRLDRRG
jgi:hypothetical protein